jgi:TPR repeat protein
MSLLSGIGSSSPTPSDQTQSSKPDSVVFRGSSFFRALAEANAQHSPGARPLVACRLGSDPEEAFEANPVVAAGFLRVVQMVPVQWTTPQSEEELAKIIATNGPAMVALIFLAHGQNGQIRAWKDLMISTLNPAIFQPLSRDANVVFLSCEAGQGIAAQLALQIPHTVIAPTGDTSGNNYLEFDPTNRWRPTNPTPSAGLTIFRGNTREPLPATPPISTYTQLIGAERWEGVLRQSQQEGSLLAQTHFIHYLFESHRDQEATHWLRALQGDPRLREPGPLFSLLRLWASTLRSYLRDRHRGSDPLATFALGIVYKVLYNNNQKALRLFLDAYRNGHPEAELELRDLCEEPLWNDPIAEACHKAGYHRERNNKIETCIPDYLQGALKGCADSEGALRRLEETLDHPHVGGAIEALAKAYLHQGTTLAHQGDTRRARECFLRAVEFNNPDAVGHLQHLERGVLPDSHPPPSFTRGTLVSPLWESPPVVEMTTEPPEDVHQ